MAVLALAVRRRWQERCCCCSGAQGQTGWEVAVPRRARPTASYVRPPTRGPPRLTNFLAAAGEAGGDGGPGGSPGGGHARPASIRPRTQPFFTNPFPCLLVGGGGRAGDPMIARDINNEPGATEGLAECHTVMPRPPLPTPSALNPLCFSRVGVCLPRTLHPRRAETPLPQRTRKV